MSTPVNVVTDLYGQLIAIDAAIVQATRAAMQASGQDNAPEWLLTIRNELASALACIGEAKDAVRGAVKSNEVRFKV